MVTGNVGIISDTQIPFHNVHSLPFVKWVKKHFQIPDENMMHVGDELDQHMGSLHKKNPNATHSAVEEIRISKDILKEWYSAFKLMKVCVSNHGIRWVKKASDAEIPSQLLRAYEDIIEAPSGWKWKHEWIVEQEKHTWRMIHGMGYSGQAGTKNMVMDRGISTAHGHLHSFAQTLNVNVGDRSLWGMNVGCLIDIQSYAFEYERNNRHKPVLGMGVVVNRGQMPIFVPMC